jgi:hypothetical protein
LPPSGRRRDGLRPRGSTTGDLSRIGVQDRRLGARSGAPYLVPAGLALAAALVAWLTWGRLQGCGAPTASPETQVRQALSRQERAHLDDVYGFRGGGTVELFGVRYDDVVAAVEGGRATVVAMLDAEGRVVWRDQEAKLSYLGREQFHMRPCSIALWCGEGDQFQRLRGVLLTLFRRQDAWRLGDAEAYARLLSAEVARDARERPAAGAPVRSRILAWQIRVERDTAEVGEDAEEEGLTGGAAHRLRHVFRLRREGERWVFVGGV